MYLPGKMHPTLLNDAVDGSKKIWDQLFLVVAAAAAVLLVIVSWADVITLFLIVIYRFMFKKRKTKFFFFDLITAGMTPCILSQCCESFPCPAGSILPTVLVLSWC